MNKYRVILEQHVSSQQYSTYEVLAESEEEAIEEVFDGNGELINTDIIYSDVESSDLEECILIQEEV